MAGEPGIGKNRLIYELAKLAGRELYLLQGQEDINVQDLACTVRFINDDAISVRNGYSLLACEVLNGNILFDEIDKIRPRALTFLVIALDEKSFLDSSLLGKRIYVYPGIKFIVDTDGCSI